MRDVLIIEPDRLSAKLMVVVLADAGFGTRAVGSSDAAIAAITTLPPDAIVLELSTRGGLDLVARLKADPVTRDITVIAVTARDGASLEHLALEVGCAEYIRKPIDALRFADFVRSVLGGAR